MKAKPERQEIRISKLAVYCDWRRLFGLPQAAGAGIPRSPQGFRDTPSPSGLAANRKPSISAQLALNGNRLQLGVISGYTGVP